MRNVVILRCGKSSLHPSWLTEHWDERDFELVLSYFDPIAYSQHASQPGVRAILLPGGKWDGIARTIAAFPDLREADYFWLPDDDLETNVRDINSIFKLARQFELSVCQPSLSRDSYFSHIHVIQCEEYLLRYTNSVEVMAPCLNRATFLACLPLMEESKSGFGLDWIWTRLPGGNPMGGAVLDCITVRHTRPIGSELAKTMSKATAQSEDMALLHRAGISKKPYSLCHAALHAEGELTRCQAQIGYKIWSTVRRSQSEFIDPGYASSQAAKLLRRHILRHADRSVLNIF